MLLFVQASFFAFSGTDVPYFSKKKNKWTSKRKKSKVKAVRKRVVVGTAPSRRGGSWGLPQKRQEKAGAKEEAQKLTSVPCVLTSIFTLLIGGGDFRSDSISVEESNFGFC